MWATWFVVVQARVNIVLTKNPALAEMDGVHGFDVG